MPFLVTPQWPQSPLPLNAQLVMSTGRVNECKRQRVGKGPERPGEEHVSLSAAMRPLSVVSKKGVRAESEDRRAYVSLRNIKNEAAKLTKKHKKKKWPCNGDDSGYRRIPYKCDNLAEYVP